MDARIDPVAAFGIANIGDCHVIRNAGGSAQAALRDIVISQTFLGTNEIMLIRHGQCGMTKLGPDLANEKSNAAILRTIGSARGPAAAASLKGMDFLAFDNGDVDFHELAALKADAEFLRNHPAIVKPVIITAFHYCVVGGRLLQMDIDGLLEEGAEEGKVASTKANSKVKAAPKKAPAKKPTAVKTAPKKAAAAKTAPKKGPAKKATVTKAGRVSKASAKK